ncbi:paraquat-inducible protein A [Kushneria sinocarnis]|uniref:Paraquat-inducible protein A n=1 Tax=Kushneria sinocarnis TaxID=595502 RepID=A0A420X0A2_9GAMM|nr:paraquat-inducible protein A [Kushneria sinocarnis]RKR07273.1 paraquat-inducible protein A [Kushneria sinocarnis]
MIPHVPESAITTPSSSPARLRVCHECDLVSVVPPLGGSEAAHCPRCHHVLYSRRHCPTQQALAVALAALIALLLALPFPFIAFEARGVTRSIDLFDAMTVLTTQHYAMLALLLWLVLLVLPLLFLCGVILIHGALLTDRRLPAPGLMMRSLRHVHRWMMADVFLLGVLVSMVKILSMAEIHFGISFWAFCAFVVLMIGTVRRIDMDWLWERMVGPERRLPDNVVPGLTGEAQHIMGCPACGQVNRIRRLGPHYCSRCGERQHLRGRHSLQKTLALLLVSVMLYIPAMALPIMQVTSLGDGTPQTIIGGVMLLLSHGDWPIAAIIFLASVVIPIAKILALGWLCLKSRRAEPWRPEIRLRLYRLTEFIGRWSMIDVFVVALLVALVRLGTLMSVTPGPGVLAFAAVVILTLLAALSFDPRLIWDAGAHRDLQLHRPAPPADNRSDDPQDDPQQEESHERARFDGPA